MSRVRAQAKRSKVEPSALPLHSGIWSPSPFQNARYSDIVALPACRRHSPPPPPIIIRIPSSSPARPRPSPTGRSDHILQHASISTVSDRGTGNPAVIHPATILTLPSQWLHQRCKKSDNSPSTQSLQAACSTTPRYASSPPPTYAITRPIPQLPLSDPTSLLQLTVAGDIQHPQPYRITLRRRRRYIRPRILHGLHLLHTGVAGGVGAAVCAQDGWEARQVLLSPTERFVARGCVWGAEWVCAYVDAVLWIGEGVVWDSRRRGLGNGEMAGCDEEKLPGKARPASQNPRVTYNTLRPRESHSVLRDELRPGAEDSHQQKQGSRFCGRNSCPFAFPA